MGGEEGTVDHLLRGGRAPGELRPAGHDARRARRGRRHDRRAERAQRRLLEHAQPVPPGRVGRGRDGGAAQRAAGRPRRPAPGRAVRLGRAARRAPRSSFDVSVQARAAGAPTPLHRRHGRAGRARAARRAGRRRSTSSRSRSWERQREAHLAVAEATVAKQSKWFEEWRAHIHGLERELGTAALGRRRGRLASALVKVAFLVNDLQLSGGVGVVIHHARQLHRTRPRRLARARARAGPAALGLRRARAGLHVASLRRGAGSSATTSRSRRGGRRPTRCSRSPPSATPTSSRASRTASTSRRWPSGSAPRSRSTCRWPSSPRRAGSATRSPSCAPTPPASSSATGSTSRSSRPPTGVEPRLRGPLRILIEGNPSVALKGIQDAVASVAAMREPRHVTVVTSEHEAFAGGRIDRVVGPVPHREMAALYAETDVVLKLSRVEGMFGPPLEGFHLGATCVVTEVTGHEEYVEHGWNGLVARLGRPARHRAPARPARERPARAALPAHQRARHGPVVARLGAGRPVHDAGDRAHPARAAAAPRPPARRG